MRILSAACQYVLLPAVTLLLTLAPALAISAKIIDGSPANAISAVPLMSWPAE